MASEKQWKYLIFKWAAPRGFVATALFFALAVVYEYLLVHLFTFSGLTDNSSFKFFSITVSPLFHIMPLAVIFVLISSWAYLKRVFGVPRRTSPAKRPSERRKIQPRRVQKKRFNSFRTSFGRVSRKFGETGRSLKAFFRRIGAAFLRIRGVSYLRQRLSIAGAAVESTIIVLTVFLVASLYLYILECPNLLNDLAIGLFSANPASHRFVLKTIKIAQGIAQALTP